MDCLKALFKKFCNKEIIFYLIFGVLTTLVSLIVYYFCTLAFFNPQNAVQLQIANIISWVLSVAFAYVTNRRFVFESKNPNKLEEKICKCKITYIVIRYVYYVCLCYYFEIQ